MVLPYHRLFPVTNGGMIRFVNLVQQLSHLSNLSVLTFANQVEIENFIAQNISDIESLSKKAAEKFSNEVFIMLQN